MKNLILFIINFKNIFFKQVYFYILFIFFFISIINQIVEKSIILKYENIGAFKINKIINFNTKDEIPFFGSSRCEGTFIPDSLVRNGFNYGIGGTQDDLINFMLKKECEKNKKTPIIINFDLEGLNYSLGDISNYLFNYEDKDLQKLTYGKFKIKNTLPILRYFGFYLNYFKYYLTYKSKKIYITNKGASLINKKDSKKELLKSINEYKDIQIYFKNDQTILKDLIYLIQKYHYRKFIFVVTPYHKSYKKSLKNYNEFSNFKKSFVTTYTNVKFVDFTNVDFNDEFFYNTTHLNYKGAIRFNQLFKDSLKSVLSN